MSTDFAPNLKERKFTRIDTSAKDKIETRDIMIKYICLENDLLKARIKKLTDEIDTLTCELFKAYDRISG